MKPSVRPMWIGGAVLFAVGAAASGARFAASRFLSKPGVAADGKSAVLHNGWKITPAGTHAVTPNGDMLLGSALSPDKKTLAVVSAGYGVHAVHLVSVETGQVTQTLPLGRGWNGVAWSPDGNTLYAGGGASFKVHRFVRGGDGTMGSDTPFTLPGDDEKTIYQAGVGVSPDGTTLYVANTARDTLLVLNSTDGTVKSTVKLPAGSRPYCVRVAPNGQIFVGLWASEAVLVLDGTSRTLVQTIATGRHPNDFVFSRDNSRVFVSCGSDDAVWVHTVATGAVTEKIRLTLTPKAPSGTTPCAVSLSPDEKTLYVANSDNNDVGVVDVSQAGRSRVKGFIPTGWYPTGVCASPDGRRIFIASGKGMGTVPNPVANPVTPDTQSNPSFKYIGTMLHGMVSTVDVPDAKALAAYSRQVAANSPFAGDAMVANPARAPKAGTNAIPSRVGDPSPIKHILYIIKENRTYDQVLGDFKSKSGVKTGNGDPNYTLFGENVTPNHHQLARQFVLLDNIYCDGEVSADGHPWSDAALATDFTQRTWPVSYSHKGDPPANLNLTIPPAGAIWDKCKEKGLTYRSYGEQVFATNSDAPPSDLVSGDGVTGLKGHTSAAWGKGRKGNRDTDKAEVFIEELHQFEKTNTLPQFMVMSLGEDHTTGLKTGTFMPKACVASNDIALGKIVEACTKSKYWKEMAIFIIEDDAQNGPDHVDAHRTVALVASPYIRPESVDSTFYTTSSLLRTMELILGLSPMTQYDAGATPLYAAFGNTATLATYATLTPKQDLQAMNGAAGPGVARMNQIDFGGYDRLTLSDEDALNRALWHSIKGNVPYPTPIRRALLAPGGRAVVSAATKENDKDE